MILFRSALFLALTSLSCLAAQVSQYDNQVVGKINISLVNVPQEQDAEALKVAAKLNTKEGGLFSQTEFDNDLKTLAQSFDRIEPCVEFCEGKLQLTLKIWPKPIIRTIHFSGNEKMDTKKLQKELEVPLSSIYDRKDFNLNFHKLKAFYVKKGFFEAELDYRVVPDPNSNEVDIEITICEGRSGRIKDIKFVNFTPREEVELLQRIVTKKYNLLTSWLSGEGTYNQEAVAHDEFTILNYLQDEGYADARVKIEIVETKKDKSIELHIIADKGEKYTVGKITINGEQELEEEDLCKLLQLKEGDFYSPEKARESARQMMEFYGKKGYIDSVVDFDLNLDYDTLTYNVNYTVEEGGRYRIGLVKVFGNCSTLTSVILHETLLIPGEMFNTYKLKLTEQRLQNIGFFKSVNVYAVKSDGPCGLGENYRDVHIEVEETCTGNFNAFLGFSTVESIFGGVNITERNFNINGIRGLLKYGPRALRGAGEFADIKASIGAKSRNYVFSWMKPYFMDTQWSIGFNLENSFNRYISDDYDINTYALRVHGVYQVNPFFREGWHWRLQFSHLKTHGDDVSPELIQASKIQSVISAIGGNLCYDSTDHPTCPTRGFKSRLDGELAGFGGDVNFFSVAYLNSYYFRLNRHGIVKLRGDLRFLQPIGETGSFDQIPIDERFFLGGDTVIRGFRDYTLGPTFDNHSPKGGISMQLFSIEYDHCINSYMDYFMFFDAGSLTDRVWHVGRIFRSAGLGMRISVPGIGAPITVGWGYPFNPRNRSDVKKFFLQMGGRF